MSDEEPSKLFARTYMAALAVIVLILLIAAGVDNEWPRSQWGRALLYLAFIGVVAATITPVHKLFNTSTNCRSRP